MSVNAICFIIAGIFLVIALIGGGITIKELKVPKVGNPQRIGIGIVGAIFLFVGAGFPFSILTPPPSAASTTTLMATPSPIPTDFSVTTMTLKNGQPLQTGQPIPRTGSPLTITGTYSSEGSGQVWVVVEDTPGNYYLQRPPVQFEVGGGWIARNIITAMGTAKIDFVYVTSQGNNTFQQEVKASAFDAFTQLPDGSKILQSIAIQVVQV